MRQFIARTEVGVRPVSPQAPGRTHPGHALVSLDYEMLEEKITVLVAKDEATGAVLAYDCYAKGPSDDWVVKQLVRDL